MFQYIYDTDTEIKKGDIVQCTIGELGLVKDKLYCVKTAELLNGIILYTSHTQHTYYNPFSFKKIRTLKGETVQEGDPIIYIGDSFITTRKIPSTF